MNYPTLMPYYLPAAQANELLGEAGGTYYIHKSHGGGGAPRNLSADPYLYLHSYSHTYFYLYLHLYMFLYLYWLSYIFITCTNTLACTRTCTKIIIHTTCAGSCEPGSRCRPNECIFGSGRPRGVGILE